jgi:hypothetical protein
MIHSRVNSSVTWSGNGGKTSFSQARRRDLSYFKQQQQSYRKSETRFRNVDGCGHQGIKASWMNKDPRSVNDVERQSSRK